MTLERALSLRAEWVSLVFVFLADIVPSVICQDLLILFKLKSKKNIKFHLWIINNKHTLILPIFFFESSLCPRMEDGEKYLYVVGDSLQSILQQINRLSI